MKTSTLARMIRHSQGSQELMPPPPPWGGGGGALHILLPPHRGHLLALLKLVLSLFCYSIWTPPPPRQIRAGFALVRCVYNTILGSGKGWVKWVKGIQRYEL